jgi:cysteine desulfurase family protein (TIGR01976 family)
VDIDRVRASYPALAEGFAHLDGAGGTQMAAPVADAVAEAMRSAVSNRGTASAPARRSGEIVAAARSAVADLVGAEPGGVVFGPSATTLTATVARTLAATWSPGDEVVLSRLDHDANVRPWVQTGATVRWADVDPATGTLPVEQYDALIGPRTRVVALTAASNAIGTVPDVRAVADRAHAAGALTYVDGVHATAHLPVDVAALGADFYVTSAYKWSGPHVAAVVAAPATWEPLRPAKLVPAPDQVPDRFESGTLSFELLAGVTAAVGHLASLAPAATGDRRADVLAGMAAARAYEMTLFDRLLDALAAIPAVTLLPAPEPRCPTVSFRVRGEAPAGTARRLGDRGVCVSAGDYYAYEYFTRIGLEDSGGAVRASLYHYNDESDVDRLRSGLSTV